jgi:hypothetical protein
MNTLVASIISGSVGVISALVVVWTIIRHHYKVRNAKSVTITKKVSGETITFSKTYNRQDSKKILDFMK